MTRYIGLLRAVNLAGYNQVSMSALRELLGQLGFAECSTLLQSGNIVFDGGRRRPTALERQLETEVKRNLEVSTDFFVRTAAEWEDIVACNPFPNEAERDPGRLIVMVLKDRPNGQAAQDLKAAIKGSEVVEVMGRHAYIVYPDGVGRSRLTNALIEKKLGTRGTGRNWNTVLKLKALVQRRPG